MPDPSRSNSWLRAVLFLGLLSLVLASCGPSDSLETVRRQQATGDFAGSLEPLRGLLEDPEHRDDPEVQFLYGRALALTGQVSAAEWALREAMKDPEWLVPAGLQITQGALSTFNYSIAVEITGRILEAHPDNIDALLLRAHAHANATEGVELALPDVDRILELDPDNLDAVEPRILALLALDRIDEAREALEALGERIDATEMGPGAPAWHCALMASFAEESDETDLARERWESCLELHPSHPDVVSNGVAFYDSVGEFDRSLAVMRKAQQGEPASRQYRVVLAERLRSAGENEEAGALLLEATESPDPVAAAAAWMDLTKHHQAVGDYTAAARAAERAVALAVESGNPSAEMLFERADALLLAGELDAALAAGEELSVPAHRLMIRARVAQERGAHAEALGHFDEAFRVWPDNPWARYYAAFAAEGVGDFDRAIESYRYAMRISLEATDARSRLARLFAAEGKPREALGALLLNVELSPLDLEGELFAVRLWSWMRQGAPLRQSLLRFRRFRPDQLGAALAEAADGASRRAGPAAAVGFLGHWQTKEGVDFADPLHAEALSSLVRFSVEPEESKTAEKTVRAALRAHPDAAVFHEILGLLLERRGGEEDPAREAYERALEIDPAAARALAGLGRLAAESDPEQALAWFERASTADPDDPAPQREAARVLLASGHPERARERLDAVLADHPYDADAATARVEIDLAEGVGSEHTLDLARRAVRFGRSADALALLSRVHQQRNEPERASQAAARAEALREPRDG